MAKRFGRSERIRTSDPLVPNEVRYQAALHSDIAVSSGSWFLIGSAAARRKRRARVVPSGRWRPVEAENTRSSYSCNRGVVRRIGLSRPAAEGAAGGLTHCRTTLRRARKDGSPRAGLLFRSERAGAINLARCSRSLKNISVAARIFFGCGKTRLEDFNRSIVGLDFCFQCQSIETNMTASRSVTWRQRRDPMKARGPFMRSGSAGREDRPDRPEQRVPLADANYSARRPSAVRHRTSWSGWRMQSEIPSDVIISREIDSADNGRCVSVPKKSSRRRCNSIPKTRVITTSGAIRSQIDRLLGD